MILYRTFAEVKLDYPDACMVRLCHSHHEVELYSREWINNFKALPVWFMMRGWYIVFASRKGYRR